MAYDESKLTRLKHLKALAQEVKERCDTITSTVHQYSIVKDDNSGSFAAVYHLTQDGTNVGAAINIPKDMVVESGSVVTNPDGQAAGTYIRLALQNVADPLYINVGDLIEYVTSGSQVTDCVVINVDGTTHKVTATLTDGTVTKAKLDSSVQAAIDNATKVEASNTNGNIKINGTETVVYTLPADVIHGAVAEDTEVTEMLTEVFA